MSDLMNKFYELRDYEDEAIAYTAKKTIEINKLFEDGYITKKECTELLEDLRQTIIVSEKAEALEDKILLEQMLGDLIKGVGVI